MFIPSNSSNCNDDNITISIAGLSSFLLVISEILPYIKIINGNSIVHGIHLILKKILHPSTTNS